MANAKQYYKYPFADNGNYDDVPDQASGGVVDYESGYGPDYEKAVGVEGRKRIDRTSFNGVLHALTDNVKQWQERNFPTWIEDDGSSDPAVPFSYPKGIIVSHNGINWASTQEGNTDEPSESSPNWDLFESSRRAMIDDVHYIGSTILTFESASPQIKYPWQTWSLISGDASIRLGSGGTNSTAPSGSNTPVVPVAAHNHSAGTRTKSDDTGVFLYGNKTASYNGVFMSVGSSGSTGTREGYTSTEGTSGATLDVRGASIKMNLWLRTA